MPSVSDIIKNNRVIKYYSTGSIGLDYIISGGLGLPSGSMIEFFGRSDSGKTATVLQIVKTALLEKPTSKVLYFNIDGKFNPEFATDIGIPIDISDTKLYIENDQYLMSDVFSTIEKNATMGKYDIFIVDNIASLTTKEEIQASYEENPNSRHFMFQLDKGLKKLRRNIANTKAVVIFVNQVRHNFETGFGYKAAFDSAIEDNMDVRIDVSRVENVSREGDLLFGHKRIGHRIEFTVMDNSRYRTNGKCSLYLYYGESFKGFDIPGEYISYGFETGLMSSVDNKYKMRISNDSETEPFSYTEMIEWLRTEGVKSKHIRQYIILAIRGSDKWYAKNNSEDKESVKEKRYGKPAAKKEDQK